MKRAVRVVVVTGASSGIGRATALALASKGKDVVVCARRKDALESLAAECRQHGARVRVVPADVTDSSAVRAVAEEAVAHFGALDAWVNNAGVFCFGELEETPEEVARRVFEVNVLGVVNGCKAALPVFRRQGHGCLVNVASLYGHVPAPYVSLYASSKHAVRGLTECLRAELRGTGIDVCLVSPPSVDTPLWEHAANFSGWVVKPVPPVYGPQRVAASVVASVERPRRERFAGATGPAARLLHGLAPELYSRLVRTLVARFHFADRPAGRTPGNLFAPVELGTGLRASATARERMGVGPGRRWLALPAMLPVLFAVVRSLLRPAPRRRGWPLFWQRPARMLS